MVDAAIARTPHQDRRFATSGVLLEAAAPATRMGLRAGPEVAVKLTGALGVKLPLNPKSTKTKGDRHALWLGPDEWLIINDAPDKGPDIFARLAKFDCSCVDVSHRNTAITVSGPGAENLLAAGCPQDLAPGSFPVGACSRTVFGKIEIVLWRLDDDTFRAEVWRSFSDYLWAYLEDAEKHAIA